MFGLFISFVIGPSVPIEEVDGTSLDETVTVEGDEVLFYVYV